MSNCVRVTQKYFWVIQKYFPVTQKYVWVTQKYFRVCLCDLKIFQVCLSDSKIFSSMFKCVWVYFGSWAAHAAKTEQNNIISLFSSHPVLRRSVLDPTVDPVMGRDRLLFDIPNRFACSSTVTGPPLPAFLSLFFFHISFPKNRPQNMSCMLPGDNNGVSNPENLYLLQVSGSHIWRFSHNFKVSNLPQKDLFPFIFLDCARLYVNTPLHFELHRSKRPCIQKHSPRSSTSHCIPNHSTPHIILLCQTLHCAPHALMTFIG